MVLELWAKMLLVNQIAGFFKMPYLKKEVDDKVYFWQEHRSLLQVDSITFSKHSQPCPKYPKQQVYNAFSISQKNVRNEVDFLPADKL